MKVKEKIAKLLAKTSMSMAKKACGAASIHHTYQPKEPKALEKMMKR